MNNEQRIILLKLAKKVTEEPLLMRKLSNLVYQLMQEDLRQKRERYQNYRGLR